MATDLIGGSIRWNLDIDDSKFKKGLSSAREEAKGLAKDLSKAGDRGSQGLLQIADVTEGLNKQIRNFALVATGALTGLLTFGFLQTKSIQNQVAGIKSLTKNSAEAGKVISDMVDYVQGKPFDRLDAIGAAKQLLAMGGAVKDLNRHIDLLGRMAIISGSDLQTMAGIFGKIESQGKLTAVEFNQLTQAGIAIGPALVKQLGVPIEKVREIMRDGSIDFSTFRGAMENLLPADVVANAGDTIDQRLSSLSASVRGLAFDILGVDFNKIDGRPLIKPNSLLDKIVTSIEDLTKVIRGADFKKFAQTTGKVLTQVFQSLLDLISFLVKHKDEVIAVAIAFGTFVVLANVANWAFKLYNAWQILTQAMIAAKFFGGLVGLASFIGPQGVILIGIAAIAAIVGVLFLAWTKNWGGIREKTKAVVEFVITLFNNLKDAAVKSWGAIIKFWDTRLKPVFSFLKEAVKDSIGFLIDKFNQLKDKVAPILKPIADNFDKIAKAVGIISAILVAPLVFAIVFPVAWKKNLFGIRDRTKEVFDQVSRIVSSAMEKVALYMLGRIDTIYQGWVAGFNNMVDQAFLWGVNMYQTVDQWLTDVSISVNDWVTNSIVAVEDWASKTLAALDQGLTNWLLAIDTFFVDLPNKFNNWLDNVWQNIKTWWSNLGKNTLDETIKGMEKERKNWILEIGKFILLALGLTLAFIAAEVLDLGVKIIRLIIKGAYGLDKWSKEQFINVIKGAIDIAGKIATDLFNFGKGIVTKIVDGIKSAPGALLKAIVDILPSGAVRSAVGKALRLPGYAKGGIVPGPIGAPQLAVVHGGEEIIPAGGQKAGKGVTINQTNYITKETDMEAALRELGFKLSI